MRPVGNRDGTRTPSVLGVGAIAAALTAFSVLMALVSVALYRTERKAIGEESIDEESTAGFPPE